MDSRAERAGGSRQHTPVARTLTVWLRNVCLGTIAALLAGSGGIAAPAAFAQGQPPFLDAGRLFATDGHPQEHFGHAVALDGDTLAVGAPNARVGNDRDQGAVYVYVRGDSRLDAPAAADRRRRGPERPPRVLRRAARGRDRRRRPLRHGRRQQQPGRPRTSSVAPSAPGHRRRGSPAPAASAATGSGRRSPCRATTLAVGAPDERQLDEPRRRRGARLLRADVRRRRPSVEPRRHG